MIWLAGGAVENTKLFRCRSRAPGYSQDGQRSTRTLLAAVVRRLVLILKR
jgi:hypothetical protein